MTMLPDKLPNPPQGLLVIFSPGSFAWIADALKTIYLAQKAQLDRQDAVIAALGPLVGAIESLMTQDAALTAEVATLKQNVADLADRISSEISDLAAAVAAQGQPSQAVTDAIADLQATNAQLSSLSQSLAADDVSPAPPTP